MNWRYVPKGTLGGAMLGERKTGQAAMKALAGAIAGVGSNSHVERLVDLIGALVPHDLITIVRYSATQRPEFVSHRNFSDLMVRKYLDIYYVYDPFYDDFYGSPFDDPFFLANDLERECLRGGSCSAEAAGISVTARLRKTVFITNTRATGGWKT